MPRKSVANPSEPVIVEEQSVSRPALPVLRRHWWLVIGAILVVALAVVGFLLYARSQKALRQTRQELDRARAASPMQNRDETRALVAKAGRLIVLPSDEEPTIATVTDVSKLQDQPFFANAQVGDKVLIYAQAKKAVLYRESEDKIIEVAPVNLGEQGSAPADASND